MNGPSIADLAMDGPWQSNHTSTCGVTTTVLTAGLVEQNAVDPQQQLAGVRAVVVRQALCFAVIPVGPNFRSQREVRGRRPVQTGRQRKEVPDKRRVVWIARPVQTDARSVFIAEPLEPQARPPAFVEL